MTEGKTDKHRKKATDLRNRIESAVEDRDNHVGDMYVDGLSVRAISDLTGLKTARVSRVIRELRESGRPMERTRTVRRSGTTWGDRRRVLTDHEASVLRSLEAAVPRNAGGARVMTSPAGAVLMDEIVRLVDSDRVVIGAVARTLGLSRQGVQMHLVNRKVARMSV
jgi:hypothetical protein